MLKLFDIPLSPFAQKVKIALIEKDLEFETVPVSLASPPEELTKLNPRAEVPILLDGDTAVWDSTIILDYLEDRFPEPGLWPQVATERSPAERARVRELEEVCDTHFDAVNWGGYEVAFFQRAEGEEAAAILATAERQVARLQAFLERQLESQPWLNGPDFGRADLAAYPFVAAAWAMGHRRPEDAPLAIWLGKCLERASVQRARDDVRQFLAEQQGAPIGRRRTYRGYRLDWMMRSGGRGIVERGIADETIAFSKEIE
jgi:glutathione S-transferase/RNA polymerase-associated protein